MDLLRLMDDTSHAEGAQSSGGLLSAPEAERMIEQLQTFSLADVGTPRWHTQRDWISRLMMAAFHNASTHSDEFVVELLVSLDKMQTLVHDLLVIETWKLHVLPHLRQHLVNKVDLSYTYLVLQHELSVAHLLQATLFHDHARQALPEEHLLELVDWCARKLTYLASPAGHAQSQAPELSAKELLDMTKEADLQSKESELDFQAAMASLSIARFLTESITKLPMCLMARFVSTHDFPMALVALLDSPPWVRRRGKQRTLERWETNANTWVRVDPKDRLKLGMADGQVWLMLLNLLVDPQSRAKYAPDEWRREKLLSLKRHMHEVLFDQLPVLKDLQRTLDEMALGVGGDAGAARNAALLLEAVPMVRETLLKDVPQPKLLAVDQARTCFSESVSRKSLLTQWQGILQGLDALSALAPEPTAPAAAQGDASEQGASSTVSLPGPIRVSCWRKAHDSGVYESWCDYEFTVDAAKAPEPVSLETLHGLRYRLSPADPSSNRAMPTNGKVAVKLSTPQGPVVAEALLQLPDIPVKSLAGDKPPVVWVNIGLLADEGLVLQLKLKRMDSGGGQERDRVAGVWYAYHPVGGALTLRRDAEPAVVQTAAKSQEGLVPAVGLVGVTPSAKGAANGLKPLISAVEPPRQKGQESATRSSRQQAGQLQPSSHAVAAVGKVSPSSHPTAKQPTEPPVPQIPPVTVSDLDLPD